MNYSATVMLVDGKSVVTEADDVIHVHEDLWQEIIDPDSDAHPALGHATFVGDVLSFGTSGEGLGRLDYVFVRHDVEARVRVFKRA